MLKNCGNLAEMNVGIYTIESPSHKIYDSKKPGFIANKNK